MRILILGGDGYLGWPTAMYLSRKGHEVWVVDNYLRRRLCLELDVEPLLPLPSLPERARIWKKVSGFDVRTFIGDCRDYDFMYSIFKEAQPDAVVHYAEQPSAPYSMLNHKAASLTVINNLQSTLNVVWSVHKCCPECHIIKIGTMGEYGTPEIDIEEGWIEIEHKGKKDRFLFPRQASSLYHTTKIQDTDLLWFYVRTWGIMVTDLMQGPVYGISTDETELNESLSTVFNYDEIFGTVLNRFIVQAVIGHPLTVYGKGGQTRGYINIRDTIACIELSLLNPPEMGQLRILNQITETFSVNELADRVRKACESLGIKVHIKHVENPRVEKEDHYYNPTYTGLIDLGLKPHYLSEEVIINMVEKVLKYKKNISKRKIFWGVKW